MVIASLNFLFFNFIYLIRPYCMITLSDHTLSRCLVYGAFADLVRVACHSTVPEGHSSIDSSSLIRVEVRTYVYVCTRTCKHSSHNLPALFMRLFHTFLTSITAYIFAYVLCFMMMMILCISCTRILDAGHMF